MRRLFAYITLCITMVIGIVVCIPTIKDKTNPGTEYNGGTTTLYHLTDSEHEEYVNKDIREAKIEQALNNINARLKALNISNPQVDLEGDSYIRVTLPEMKEDDLLTTKYVIQNNGFVTVRDAEDNLICNAKDVFSSIELITQGDNCYVQVKIADYEAFEEATNSLAATYQAAEDGSATPNMFIWIGFEEEYAPDLQDKLNGQAGDFAQVLLDETYYAQNQDGARYTLSKLLTAVAVDTAITEDFTIQAIVGLEDAKAYNAILSEGGFTYLLNEEYTAEVGSYFAEGSMNRIIIAIAAALIIIAVLLVVCYKYAGITSALSVIACSVIVVALYNVFGGLFGAETLLALMVGIGLAVDANIVILERCKDEIRKGKTIARAYEEGSKKSVSTILDSNIIVLIAAFALYLFGNQVVKSFSAVLIIFQVTIMIVVILFTRYTLLAASKSKKIEGKPEFFGVKKEEIINKEDLNAVAKKSVFDKVEFVKNGKKKGIISGAIACVGIACAIIFGLVSGVFNYNANEKSGYKVFFRTFDPTLNEVSEVEDFFASEDYAGKKPVKVIIENTRVEMTNDDYREYENMLTESFHIEEGALNGGKVDVYNVECYFSSLSQEQIAAIDDHFNALAEKVYLTEDEAREKGSEYSEVKLLDMCYSCNAYEPTSGHKALLNSILAIGMLCVFAIVYLSIRFSFSYSLSAVLTTLHNEVILYALLIITRLQIGTWAIAAGLAVAVLTLGNVSITFDKLRENVGEAKGVIWTIDTRKEFINKALQQTMYGHLFSNIATLVIAILALCVGHIMTAPIAISCVFVVLATAYGSYLIMPFVWAHLDTFFANLKAKNKENRAKRQQGKPQVDANEPEEYVFFGIND